MNAFVAAERVSQGSFFTRTEPEHAGFQNAAWRLKKEGQIHNLAPSIRVPVAAYFGANKIHWHIHANHGLSSQVCCVNFLAPLARRPDILARLVQTALGGEIEMLPVPDGQDWYVGFEWIGGDHLNESVSGKARSRGANATSADAVLMFKRNGIRETLLIEWKYTESYGSPVDAAGNATRVGRYRDIAFAPNGPIRADLGLAVEDFLWEPYYQLLRQQMLAWHMEKAKEDSAEIVRVLHISPSGNTALKAVTAPALRQFGTDLATAWPAVLVQPDRFRALSIAALFGKACSDCGAADDWAGYLMERYASLLAG